MRAWVLDILLSLALILGLTGCDVHEFPQDTDGTVQLHLYLDFDTELPLYKTINYTRGEELSGAGVITENHDIRYILQVYRTDNIVGENRIADTTFVFTKPDTEELNHQVSIRIKDGKYNLRVWADYVDRGSTEDKYYDTSDFAEIILLNKDEHKGSNEYRDAFKGEIAIDTRAAVPQRSFYTEAAMQTTIEMKRPMGKFEFIATDGDDFVSRIAQLLYEQETRNQNEEGRSFEQIVQSIDLSQFKVVFRYNNFMPCSFNMFTNKPADAWSGVSFQSVMKSNGEEHEMSLGYDYVFVGENSTSLSISVDVYDRNGLLLSSSKPINVPIVRNKLTVVKGNLLALTNSTGGAVINPGYDGDDYNMEI